MIACDGGIFLGRAFCGCFGMGAPRGKNFLIEVAENHASSVFSLSAVVFRRSEQTSGGNHGLQNVTLRDGNAGVAGRRGA